MDIEKAKKADVDSVKHLSKHSDFISDFDEEKNMVIPKKLMNSIKEDTYEDAKLIETFSDSYDLNELWKKYDEILAGYTKDTYQFDLIYFKDIMPLRCDNP